MGRDRRRYARAGKGQNVTVEAELASPTTSAELPSGTRVKPRRPRRDRRHRSARGATTVTGPFLSRQMLGLAVLLLAVVPGYLLSQLPARDGQLAFAIAVSDPRDWRLVIPPSGAAINSHIHIKDAAARYGVSEPLVAAIIAVESEFNPRAVSHKGARGLMQLMPATASSLRVADSFDPRANIEGGVRHLRRLMDRFDNNLPLVLAAYNAGEQVVITHRGIPPNRETREFVARVLRRLDQDGTKTARDRGQAALR